MGSRSLSGDATWSPQHSSAESRSSKEPKQFGKVGNIRLVASLGKGGMGEVFVGHDEVLDRRVAVKSIRRGLLDDPTAKARFLREARLLSQFEHPNICRVYEFSDAGSGAFLIMELIEGQTLPSAMKGMSFERKLRVGSQIGEALRAAHQRGIIHRDLKPENVMIDHRGEVKVLDFGLARHHVAGSFQPPPGATGSSVSGEETAETRLGAIVGSPAYMSPEQARGESLGPATDLFSLGLLLQELFEEQRAYDDLTEPALLIAHARRAKSRPMTEGDRDLVALVQRLKDFDPAKRPSAQEAARRLDWIRERPKRRTRLLAAAAIASLLGFGAFKYTADLRAERQRALEAQNRAESLIGFIVEDLYQGLEPVGRVDLLEQAAEHAQAYYRDFGDTLHAPEQLPRQAVALKNSGLVLEAVGRHEEALIAFQQARNILEGVLADQRTNHLHLEASESLATILSLTARAVMEQGDLEQTLALSLRSLALRRQAETLAAPGNQREPERLTKARLEEQAGVAWVLREMGRAEEALAELDQVIEEAGDLQTDPRDTYATAYSYRGTALAETNQFEGALEDYRRAFQLTEELLEENNDARLRYDLLLLSSRIGESLLSSDDPAGARRAFEQSRDQGLELVASDPLNADWQRELAVTHSNLGELLFSEHRFTDSLIEYRAATRLSRSLFDRDSSNASYRNDLAFDSINTGRALAELGRSDEARKLWMNSVELMRPITDRDHQSQDGSAYYLSTLALAQLHLDQLEAAAVQLRRLQDKGWIDLQLQQLAREKGLVVSLDGSED